MKNRTDKLLYDIFVPWNNTELFSVLHDVLSTLSAKEKFVIEQRYGLTGEKPKTLTQVAALVKPTDPQHEGNNQNENGLTRERIRQIEAKALRKLHHPSRLNPLLQSIGLMRYRSIESIAKEVKATPQQVIETESIEVLLLPSVIENALWRCGVRTIRELKECIIDKEILDLRGMGEKRAQIVKETLAEYERLQSQYYG